ncbi:sensor histidine kinase LiaS [Paenibacillus baekrokdamisoli]|uniref:Oxygen sensor histidine kinase NreB n=1 Tax=Paenibacillus baekrokdamisoli TaxID=1712516 RepID=A0A3G9JEI1_9BACL|nr:sensor histidine kinase [Paenibacillus baekrokdamisoli]MBB3071186.1 NarL family two-component system sensor histidine kinase LiaS [Paenibacillus baekrokdamisoli]BBH21604.1 sensor histidine kinase LiaS [Paenibacillus baekrokdamisoli]
MMVRLFRNSKWEMILLFTASSALSVLIWTLGSRYVDSNGGINDLWIGIAAVVIIVSAAFGYWTAQRTQRQIDVLYLGLKQATHGNYASRLPQEGARSFTAVYQEYNDMMELLDQRMQWVQLSGEEQVMRENASNEAAVLEERKRLARDLHDTVSQQLFAIHMSASSLPKLLELNQERAASVMEQLISMSSLAQKQMRGYIAHLRPLELEGRSLQEALDKWFPDYCRQNGLQGVLDWGVKEKLSEAKEHQLFLIIQEAMANIVKHAGAQTALLTITQTERQILMTLQDNGAGFRADQVKRGSYGLSTMRERANKLGGDTSIISKPGSGTRIRVTLPNYMNKGAEPQQ